MLKETESLPNHCKARDMQCSHTKRAACQRWTLQPTLRLQSHMMGARIMWAGTDTLRGMTVLLT